MRRLPATARRTVARTRVAPSVATPATAPVAAVPLRFRAGRPMVARPKGWFFPVILGLYLAVAITKVHEALPGVASLPTAKVLAALLLPAAALSLEWRHVLAGLRSRPAVCVAVIATLAVLSVPGSLWPGYAVQFLTGEYWKTLVLFVIMVGAWIDRRALHVALVSVVLGAMPPALNMVMRGAEAQRARFGLAFDANEAALMFLVIIPVALYLANRRGWLRIVWLVAALLDVGAIVRTGSRGGFLGLMALGIVVIVNSAPRQRMRQILLAGAGVIAFAVTANESTWERFRSIGSPTQDYNYDYQEGRIEIWKRGMNYMLTHPLLGVGVQNFPIAEGTISGKVNVGEGIKYSAAHNSFVEIGAELGIGGLIAFTIMLWSAGAGVRRVKRIARQLMHARKAPPMFQEEYNLAAMALSSLIAFAVAGSFLSFAYHPVTHFVIAVCVAVSVGFRAPAVESAPPRPRGRRVA